MYSYFLGLLSLCVNSFAQNIQELALLNNNLISLAEISRTKASSSSDRLKLLKENAEGLHLFTEYKLGNTVIRLVIQDILQEPADAIVNAANSGCLSGGGIDGIISSRGGDSTTKPDQHTTLYDLRLHLPPLEKSGERCPEGSCRITRGGWLQYPYTDKKVGDHVSRKQYNYVIHAVGPRCYGKVTVLEKKKLASTYLQVLERVNAFNKDPKDSRYAEFSKIDITDLKNYRISSLNFPTISTGIFGCTTAATASSVVEAVHNFIKPKTEPAIDKINFVFWDPTNSAKAREDYNLYKKAFDLYLNKQ